MWTRIILLWIGVVVVTILISVNISLTADRLDDEIASVEARQKEERQRIAVLRASYAHLTSADQLQILVERHLPELAPLRGDQVVSFRDLPLRPPPAEEPPQVNADPDIAVPADDGEVAPIPRRRAPVPSGNPPWLRAGSGTLLQPVHLQREER